MSAMQGPPLCPQRVSSHPNRKPGPARPRGGEQKGGSAAGDAAAAAVPAQHRHSWVLPEHFPHGDPNSGREHPHFFPGSFLKLFSK